MTVQEGIEIARKNLIEVLPEMANSPLNPTHPNNSLAEVLRSRRISKQVEIDTETGSLIALKNAVA